MYFPAIEKPRMNHAMCATILGNLARWRLGYVLEFYVLRNGGPKKLLDTFAAEEGSLDDARDQAKSIMRHVKLAGELANLCVVKTQSGIAVCELRPEARPR